MPNWCSNDLFVTGELEAITSLMAYAKQPSKRYPDGNEDLNFDAFIPYPDEFMERTRVASKRSEWLQHPENRATWDALMNALPRNFNHDLRWWSGTQDGYNSGGYEWCIQNWGTKWNACYSNGWEWVQTYKDGREQHLLTFETAWSPPTPVVVAMSQVFPSVTFTLKYYECGMAYQGIFRVKAGNVTIDRTRGYRGSRGG